MTPSNFAPPAAKSVTRTAPWCLNWTKWKCRPPGPRWPATSWRRSISAKPACPPPSRRWKTPACPSGCGATWPMKRRWRSLSRRPATAARPAPGRFSTGWPAPGPIGAGRAATSTRKPMPGPISMKCVTCWRPRSAPPIHPNGSTPGCTGPTASTAPPRATTTSTIGPAS